MIKNGEKQLVFLCLAVIFIILIILSYYSVGSYGGADSFVHYRIARYSWNYPHLFLDQWGKPLFTLFSSPFAQFGFYGIKFFNVLITLISAYVAYLIARKMEFHFPVATILFLCFSPMYFMLALTGLTETFFSLIIILAVYLFLEKKFISAAILISLAPFARQEGVLFILFFLIALMMKRKYAAVPFLLFGLFLFCVSTIFVYDDFFWIFNHVPYTGKADYYGSGEFFHFIKNYKEITGVPLAILFVTGITAGIYPLLKRKHEPLYTTEYLLLIVAPTLAYLGVHSFLWWKGLSGSLGLTRVMTSVLPLVAVSGAAGLSFFLSMLPGIKSRFAFTLIVLSFMVYAPFAVFQFPVKLDEPQSMMKDAATWMVQHHHDQKRIYYYDPFLVYLLGKDPFDPDQSRERVLHTDEPSRDLPSGSILVWDSHFGPNEGNLPKAILFNDSNLVLLKDFHPTQEFRVLGGYSYEINVFERK